VSAVFEAPSSTAAPMLPRRSSAASSRSVGSVAAATAAVDDAALGVPSIQVPHGASE
jgi:hypothetical protein